jgi:Caspase domain
MSFKHLSWILLCLCCAASPVRAQTLHVISAVDIHDFDLGAWFGVNSDHVETSTKYLATAADLKLKFTKITNPERKTIACQAILDSVRSLQVQPDDVVLFYYSGHGFRPEDQRDSSNIFPWFVCDDFPPPGKTPNLMDVHAALLQKHARLTITIADACNNFLQEGVAAPRMARIEGAARIKAMLRQFRGGLVMSGSKRGQFSYYFTTGGYFTNQLLEVLENPLEGSPSQLWAEAIKRATAPMQIQLQASVEQQDPQASDPADLVYVAELSTK